MSIKKILLIILFIKLLFSLGVLIPNNAIAFLAVYIPAVSSLFEENLFFQYGLISVITWILHIFIIILFAFSKRKLAIASGISIIVLLVVDSIIYTFFYLTDAMLFSGVLGIVVDGVCFVLMLHELKGLLKNTV